MDLLYGIISYLQGICIFFKYMKLYFMLYVLYFFYNPHVLALAFIFFFIFYYFYNNSKKKYLTFSNNDYIIPHQLLFYYFFNKSKTNFSTKNNKFFIFNTFLINYFYYFYFFIFLLSFIFFYYIMFFNFSEPTNLNYFHNVTFYTCQLFSIKFDWLIYLDSISIYFIILTSFIFLIVYFNLYSLKFKKDYYLNFFNLSALLLLYIEGCLILTFSTSNIFFFFFFFEASLIPLYILVQIGGKGLKKKSYAMFSLLFFTLTGSIFLLCGIFFFLNFTGSCDFRVLTFEKLSFNSQLLLFMLFFLGFAFKAPMFPFYSWLPEAHVEASTSASILLAAIFLKIAGYGILRVLVFNCENACHYLQSLILIINIFSIIVVFLVALTQTDLKKIIALSSIGHMNYILIGLFSMDSKAILGSILYMGAHALISSALFILIGIIYENTGSRDLFNFFNIKNQNSKWSFFFLMFSLANVSFPGFVSFFCELIIFNNISTYNIFALLIIIFAIFLSTIYTFWIMHNVLFGKIFKKNYFILTKNEVFLLTILLFGVFIFGLFPLLLMKNLEQDIYIILIKNIF